MKSKAMVRLSWLALALLPSLGCSSPGGGAADGGHEHGHHDEDLAVARPPSPGGPARLSETGLYADIKARRLAPGILAFSPAHELWVDGAGKARWLLLPAGTKIDTSRPDEWRFPIGTKAWKQFTIGGRLVETRILEKKKEGPAGWWQVAYLWLADGSDAVAVPDGAPDALGTRHDVPSQEDCGRCHDGVSDVLIGVSAIQLSDGGKGLLGRLAAQGALTHPPAGELRVPGTGTVQAALGYLHGNCGNCHNDRFTNRHPIALRLQLRSGDRVPEGTAAYGTIFGQAFHNLDGVRQIVVRGRPEASQLWTRMAARGDVQMPPLGTEVVDAAGTRLIGDWIRGL